MSEFLDEALSAFIDTGAAILLAFYVVILLPIWFPLWAWRKLTEEKP